MRSIRDGRSVTFASLVALACAAATGAEYVRAQQCEPSSVQCNHARFYSGTVRWQSTLKTEGDTAGTYRDSVVVTVDRGRARCSGTTHNVREHRGHAPSRWTERGEITGEGLLVIETPRRRLSERRGSYRLRVACPQPATEWRLEEKGKAASEGSEPGAPASLDEDEIAIDDRIAKDYSLLEGRETYDHPDADEVNRVSGTVTVAWRLTATLPAAQPAAAGGKRAKPN